MLGAGKAGVLLRPDPPARDAGADRGVRRRRRRAAYRLGVGRAGARCRAAQSLAEAGRIAGVVALGLAGVLLVSGVIEAFVTPSGLPTAARIGIGALAELGFLTYVIVLGRRGVRAGATGDLAVERTRGRPPRRLTGHRGFAARGRRPVANHLRSQLAGGLEVEVGVGDVRGEHVGAGASTTCTPSAPSCSIVTRAAPLRSARPPPRCRRRRRPRARRRGEPAPGRPPRPPRPRAARRASGRPGQQPGVRGGVERPEQHDQRALGHLPQHLGARAAADRSRPARARAGPARATSRASTSRPAVEAEPGPHRDVGRDQRDPVARPAPPARPAAGRRPAPRRGGARRRAGRPTSVRCRRPARCAGRARVATSARRCRGIARWPASRSRGRRRRSRRCAGSRTRCPARAGAPGRHRRSGAAGTASPAGTAASRTRAAPAPSRGRAQLPLPGRQRRAGRRSGPSPRRRAARRAGSGASVLTTAAARRPAPRAAGARARPGGRHPRVAHQRPQPAAARVGRSSGRSRRVSPSRTGALGSRRQPDARDRGRPARDRRRRARPARPRTPAPRRPMRRPAPPSADRATSVRSAPRTAPGERAGEHG